VGPSKEHRHQHLAWDGALLPRDDPFWAVANPRNGWGCKCYTRFVSEAQYRRYTTRGITHPATGDQPTKPGKQVLTTAPVLAPMQYTNPRTGETHTGYRGIDPGVRAQPRRRAHPAARRAVHRPRPAPGAGARHPPARRAGGGRA